MRLRNHLTGYLFLSPWLIGLFVFTVGPMVSSLYLSFTEFDLFRPAQWIGLENYRNLFLHDERFYQSLKVTFFFAFISVPARLIVSLLAALLLNQGLRGIGLYRSVFYLPSLVGGSVGVAVMWRQIFGQDGILNVLLGRLGLEGKVWIAHPDYAIYTIILLGVWQFGASMVIFLAGLKQIPEHLYEAAAIDGASRIRKFTHITLPMLSPVIFFNLIMQTIGAFMVFTQGFVITKGGPMDSTLFYALYLYEKGFTFFQMGYASAMAWILLAIVAIFTALIFSSSKMWVHYESGNGGR
ncbi:sugar ABC transporter permease [Paenibacillus sp. J5C_2022]|uniref:carbohydrate ABC transporter permease n=1 Tax=Paenibacillus sp. J5C2022 TaxID=2977129 RepID=UPI0021CEE541|nr:sugar ABC transporter permease [Paenibacillus sp. J5C2022]MCU6707791.1 sugar ABC transporter permease [Paenibacillus sp. J5C2022]